ncbi:nSTAND1 domain-containing NTPase [Sorangium sp. So ce1153]|uniref:nSTAND1 domain-containing NTPase n=1 Tax=Sorangium sp. So ce1153 TaxID=3133333 RepID=UPI003F63D0B0
MRPIDVPQADNLARVRLVLNALAEGERTLQQIAKRTKISHRHVQYYLQSARVLKFATGTTITDFGAKLLATPARSFDERHVFKRAIEGSDILLPIAADLFSADPPDHAALTKRIKQWSGLSTSTAARRAKTLLAWRRQILAPPSTEKKLSQLSLPLEGVASPSAGIIAHSARSAPMSLSADIDRRLGLAFRPHAPIEDRDAFQGRVVERERVEAAIASPGLHVIIYGERGAGKTSLANVSVSGNKSVRLFCEKRASFSDLCASIVLEYVKLQPPQLIFDATSNSIRVVNQVFRLDALNGNSLRSILPTGEDICIVLDEVDRLASPETLGQLAELCKNLSTYQTNVTIIMVGVADTADELLRGHASNVRNLKQVHLGRMTADELKSILRHGEAILSLAFNREVETRIIEACDLFPYYLHLLAMNSAKSALRRGSSEVTLQDYLSGVESAASDCDETLRSVYETAVLSVKQSEIYRLTVWAMAEMGTSATVGPIAERVNALARKEGRKTVTVQSIGQAIRRLCEPERKEILTSRDPSFYGFSNPLMRGYVRLIRERS